jgi:hypothetical protein
LEIVHNGRASIGRLRKDHRVLELIKTYDLNEFLSGYDKFIDMSKIENITAELTKIATDLGFEAKYIAHDRDNDNTSLAFFNEEEKIILRMEWSHPEVELSLHGNDVVKMRALCETVLSRLPDLPEEEPREEKVVFRFWHNFQDQAVHYDKTQNCKGLSDIEANYSPSVFQKLAYVQDLPDPDKKGKVIIWHGKPGGGKTYAVRALARDWAWNKGASIEIILDPHVFLSNAAYMRQVALNNPNQYRASACDQPNNPIRLIILEDHAELFTSKCRESQGLSTILNLTDGILGNDLRLIFLLTANEDIKEIDPAIQRPRRCIGVTEFKGFNREEAAVWGKNIPLFQSKLDEVYPTQQELALVDLYHVQDILEEEANGPRNKSAEQVLQS